MAKTEKRWSMEQNLSHYKIFYEVAKAGNISKAAKELFISQPAISKSISKLEDGLGVTLFVRSSRGVQLTEEGRLLFHYAESAFNSLNFGEHELKRIKEFHIGHLKMCIRDRGSAVGQALAMYADGDRLFFDSCRFLGGQDTLFTGPLPPKEIEVNGFIGPKQHDPRINGRHYYKNFYI